MKILSRLAHTIAGLPRRILAAAGWAQMEPMGLGVGEFHTGDLEDLEADKRARRETWRREDDEVKG